MDRVIVGDVGYGKTEVALRAAFAALEAGRQVALLVPTTILALQHIETFRRRLAAYPFRLELLSRSISSAKQAEVVAGLNDGSVDLVVATHRLLSKDVSFSRLGLLVVDEEHRFGVAAKERLKSIRAELDVMTLTATPIPRTLNLALSGIRDLSTIETPPEDRHPVATRVAEASLELVRDALARELERGGQSYYVHNRVESIEAAAEQLRGLLPDARITVGHGQMEDRKLERVMGEFVRGEVFAMVGARRVHGLVSLNVAAALKSQLRGSPCRAFNETMKLQAAEDVLLYPDVFVTCDPADLRTDRIFNAPTVVVEVLS
jgi:transcription-repair coupling factor (superfamily II helicase)